MCKRTLIHAAAVVDVDGLRTPGAVLIEGHRVVAAGTPQSIGAVPDVRLIDRPGHALMPALVNAHAHLDLTHIGPRPYCGSFTEWVGQVRLQRDTTPAQIAESVRRGVALARAGGTGLIGDIAGAWSPEPINVLRGEGLGGVGFLEMFGLGRRQASSIEQMRKLVGSMQADAQGVPMGLQPHAPYSCGPELYRAAMTMGLPLATHLAETPEELQFVSDAAGPLADMLDAMGVLDETVVGRGAHPVDELSDILGSTPMIAVHLNYVGRSQMEKLAQWPVTVAYCPRASAYFGHRDHQYAQMAQLGVRVALGTDSLICLDTPDRISVFDEMRLLYRRDGADPLVLLKMATCAGAEALGVDADLVTLRPGPIAGLIGIPCGEAENGLIGALSSDEPPEWLVGPVPATML